MNKFKKTIYPIWYIFFPLLLFVVIYDIGATGIEYLMLFAADKMGADATATLIAHAGTAHALAIAGGLGVSFLCLLRWAKEDGFLAPRAETWKHPWWQYVLLVLGSIIISYVINYLFMATGLTKSSAAFQNVAANQYNVNLFVGLILYGFISPFVEEVVFRGFLYGRMKIHMNYIAAIFVSSLLFGIYHGNIVQGLYGFIMGLVMSFLYERYQNFYIPVMIHGIVNLVAFYIQINVFLF